MSCFYSDAVGWLSSSAGASSTASASTSPLHHRGRTQTHRTAFLTPPQTTLMAGASMLKNEYRFDVKGIQNFQFLGGPGEMPPPGMQHHTLRKILSGTGNDFDDELYACYGHNIVEPSDPGSATRSKHEGGKSKCAYLGTASEIAGVTFLNRHAKKSTIAAQRWDHKNKRWTDENCPLVVLDGILHSDLLPYIPSDDAMTGANPPNRIFDLSGIEPMPQHMMELKTDFMYSPNGLSMPEKSADDKAEYHL